MFIQDDDALDIKVYYRKSGKKYVAYSPEDFEKFKFTEDEKKKYTVLNVKMKVLTWGMQNDLNDAAIIEDVMGNRKISNKMFKETKLRKLITSWDAKDKDGNDVPINENTISHLAPSIAETISNLYDNAAFLGEEEEKK